MNHQSSMAMSKLSARAARAIRECIALPGCRVQGAGCRVQGVGCRVWGSGWVRVQGGSAPTQGSAAGGGWWWSHLTRGGVST